MKSFNLSRSSLALAFLIVGLGLMLAGCSKSSVPAAMQSDSFDAGPAELKSRWQTARDCTEKDDYLGAVTNLMVMFRDSKSLTSEQNAALQEAWLDIGNQAFRAGENGDKRGGPSGAGNEGFGVWERERGPMTFTPRHGPGARVLLSGCCRTPPSATGRISKCDHDLEIRK